MKNDSLGDRMKVYEARCSEQFMAGIPVIARLDGRCFHRFTNGMRRPFDETFGSLMHYTTRYLVEESCASVGYTQSDEITLVWLGRTDHRSQIFFDGKQQKMTSLLAAMCTAYFNRSLTTAWPKKANTMPLFDCRTFQVPTTDEAVNCLIWREQDATRNSIQMAARAVFSHKQCHLKSCDQLQEMLFTEKGINWNDYPDWCKRGRYVIRSTKSSKFTPEELSELPEKHDARKNPDMVVTRSVITWAALPPLTKIVNREAAIFDNAEPQMT